VLAAIKKPAARRCVARNLGKTLQEVTNIDSAAWQTFLERLRRYVAKRVPSGSRDDVVGDIMLRLVQHQQKLEASDKPLAWITRVAANVVTDYHRRRASEERAMTAYVSDPSTSAYVDEDSASSDLANCILPLIEQLPPRYRDALTLVEIEHLSQKATAAKLGLSLSGIKSRVQRGRSKLKETILRCCAVELDQRGEVMAYAPRGVSAKKQCCLGGAC